MESRGQIFGFILAIGVLGGAIFLLAHGKNIGGLATLITAVGGLVGLYLAQKKANP